jgi:hypothetical protein
MLWTPDFADGPLLKSFVNGILAFIFFGAQQDLVSAFTGLASTPLPTRRGIRDARSRSLFRMSIG